MKTFIIKGVIIVAENELQAVKLAKLMGLDKHKNRNTQK